jgi:hypothetical protein
LRHFVDLRLDSNFQADMAPVRPNTKEIVSPASAALTDLVRLLARQAAREFLSPALEALPISSGDVTEGTIPAAAIDTPTGK